MGDNMKGLDNYLDRLWHDHHNDDEGFWDGTCEVEDAVFRTTDGVYKMSGVMSNEDDIAEFHFWRLNIHGMWMDADDEIGCGETPALDAAFAAAKKLYRDYESDAGPREGEHDEF